jgi:hypothetical protein
MAIPVQGVSFADINAAVITTIEVRPQGTGSFANVGAINAPKLLIEPLSDPGENGTKIVYAVKYSITFEVVQTKKTAELTAFMAGTASQGLFDTNIELKITFANGRVITLGAVTNYPLRVVSIYEAGNEEGSEILRCAAENVELYDTFLAKVA